MQSPSTYWSGRRESNPRPTAWKAVTLPLSYSRPASKPVPSSGPPESLELTERLELSTSPLPRECSTTELRQLYNKTFKAKYFKTSLPRKLSLQSYRERYRPNRMRNAKYPMKTHVSERYFPGSIVCQTSTANTPMTASAIHILPLPAGLRSTTFQRSTRTSQTSGAQGRIRTSVTRRVADLQSAAINHSATCAHPAKPSEQTTLISTHQAPSNDPMPRIERVTSTLKKSREACMTRTASSTTKSVFLPLLSIYRCLKLELAKGLEPPTL